MKFLILSDIHLEFHRDDGVEFIESLPYDESNDHWDAEPMGVILAGDICSLRQLSDVLRRFSYRYHTVVYLPGNHEAYGFSLGAVRNACRRLQDELVNVYCLDNYRITLGGTTFAGGTMWFPDQKDNQDYERFLNDFHLIENLRNEVYKENEKAVEFLRKRVEPGDVVITHHLPSPMSIHERYEGNDLNRFFLCDVEDVIKEKQPKLWVHGHTHDSFDYTIFRTRVVCNPFGYPSQPNPKFEHLIVDL